MKQEAQLAPILVVGGAKGAPGDQNNNEQLAANNNCAHSQVTLNASELSSSDEIAKFR